MSGELVTRLYGSFRGVDFRGEEVNLLRSPDSLNVWKDYKAIDCIRTRPEMELKQSFDDKVWGIYFYKASEKEMMIVHSGTNLYKVVDGVKTVLYTNANNAPSNSFFYNSYWYFKDGKNYLQYDGETIKDVVGYVPTTSIARKPDGGGTTYEDVNLLTGKRINTFLADGSAKEFVLDSMLCCNDNFIKFIKLVFPLPHLPHKPNTKLSVLLFCETFNNVFAIV